MSIVVENEEWALSPFNYVFLFAGCFFSVFLLPYFSRNSGVTRAATAVSSPFDVGPTAPFLRFQMSFLLVYSLASVMEGLESVYGEYEFEYRGMLKEQMVLDAMRNFTTKIVSLMKYDGLFEWQGGPIILCQVDDMKEKGIELEFSPDIKIGLIGVFDWRVSEASHS